MGFNLNFKYFIFKCIDIKIGKEKDARFTFKTSSEKFSIAISSFFKEVRNICENYEDIEKINNDYKWTHKVTSNKNHKRVIEIYSSKEVGWNQESAEQILDEIYQLGINDKGSRLFYLHIPSVPNIIFPLFIDINHAIYNDKNIDKTYEVCLVCTDVKKCT